MLSRALVQPVGQPAAEAGGSNSASPLSPRLSPKARLATDDRELVRQMTLRFEAAAERMEAVLAALEAHGSRPQEVPAGDPPPCEATNPPAKQPSPAVSACLASWKSKQASSPPVESSLQPADAATTPATPATPEAPADAPPTAPSVTPKVSFGDAVLAARKAQRAAAGEADLDVSPQAFVSALRRRRVSADAAEGGGAEAEASVAPDDDVAGAIITAGGEDFTDLEELLTGLRHKQMKRQMSRRSASRTPSPLGRLFGARTPDDANGDEAGEAGGTLLAFPALFFGGRPKGEEGEGGAERHVVARAAAAIDRAATDTRARACASRLGRYMVPPVFHPEKRFKTWWNLMVVALVLISAVLVPLTVAFDTEFSEGLAQVRSTRPRKSIESPREVMRVALTD